MCIFCEKAKNELSGLTPEQIREAEACVQLQEQRVPATILTGFLGAGKTTFLNFVLKSLGHGKRIAVVQNEFGRVPIDDQLMLLEKAASETIVMPNGCLCCRVRGDLVEALRRLADSPNAGADRKIDSLLVECSGLSEVLPVAQTFFADPFVQAAFRLDSVVCVCDASNFEKLEGGSDGGVGAAGEDVAQLLREQLAISDVCLLNKCDLIDSSQRDQLAQRIRRVNPAARVVPCRQGKVNLGQVLKVNSFSLDGAISIDAHFLGEDGHGHGHNGHNGHNGHRSHAHTVMSSLALESANGVRRDVLEEWLKTVVERLGKDLIRMKGVLRAANGSLVVQGVGGHVEINEVDSLPSPGATGSTGGTGATSGATSRLVIIGRVSDESLRAELREGFQTIAKL